VEVCWDRQKKDPRQFGSELLVEQLLADSFYAGTNSIFTLR
jgi:hypothetical protein